MASASFTKFNSFVGDVGTKKIDLNGDTFNLLLTNTAPNAADTVVDTTTTPCTVKSTSNAVEVAAASGYAKGGPAIGSQAYSQSAGTGKMTGNAITVTAGASIGPFRYAVIYDASGGTTATRPVVGFFDYGSAVTLGIGDTFTVGNSNDGTAWTATYPILTLA